MMRRAKRALIRTKGLQFSLFLSTLQVNIIGREKRSLDEKGFHRPKDLFLSQRREGVRVFNDINQALLVDDLEVFASATPSTAYRRFTSHNRHLDH
jgi:hypothetical protein